MDRKWYHVCWPRLTAKRVEPVVSSSWASCSHKPRGSNVDQSFAQNKEKRHVPNSNPIWRNCKLTQPLAKQWNRCVTAWISAWLPTRTMKAVPKPSFRQCEIVNSDLVIVRGARQKVKLTKPIAVGFSMLELSKLTMYEFYYSTWKFITGTRVDCCSQTQTRYAPQPHLQVQKITIPDCFHKFYWLIIQHQTVAGQEKCDFLPRIYRAYQSATFLTPATSIL